jgi:hypothetical protein
MNAISLTAPADLAHLSVSELVRIGCDAIEKAGSFDELRAIAAKADALQTFQKAIGAATDALNAAAEIRIRAQRRMGQELADAGLAGGDRSKIPQGDFAQAKPTLADIGISANPVQPLPGTRRHPRRYVRHRSGGTQTGRRTDQRRVRGAHS